MQGWTERLTCALISKSLCRRTKMDYVIISCLRKLLNQINVSRVLCPFDDNFCTIIFFRRSRYISAFYPLTLWTLFNGNESQLIAILFPDWPKTDNLVAFEKKCIENLILRTMCYFLERSVETFNILLRRLSFLKIFVKYDKLQIKM